ncbi:LysR family transcriptional regulator [Pleionea sediminis]|uniref:LysR family transcriptional regulator n=1 Tax=Pleionea sediminis TaxID=2569479 RepID=UPI0011859BB9|nr:LysR family transcriptional regulator [Pleionea sediminis]
MQNQELSLLVVFDAIMTESSITKAAERLNTTQPAVSNAVARMRHAWKDDLFVKHGRRILPTLYAQELWQKIRFPLKEIRDVLQPSSFVPATSERAFRVAAIDSVVGLAWSKLRSAIENEAPSISIHTFPYTIENGERLLNDAKVDLLLAASNLMPPLITSQFLYEVQYVCVMKAAHPLAKKKLSLKDFANAEHLLVAPSGDVQGYTDQLLAEKGLQRKVALTLNSFANVPELLNNSNLICVLPSIFVENSLVSGSLVARKNPIDIPNTRISMYWHKRSEKDLGVAWLAEKLKFILEKRIEQHKRVLSKHLEK